MARYCLSLAKKFSITCRALYRWESYGRFSIREDFGGMTIPIGTEDAGSMGRFENGDARRKAQRYHWVSRALTTPQIRFQNGSAIRYLQFRWVYSLLCLQQWINHPLLGVIRLIGNDRLGRGVFKQNIGTIKVVSLACGEMRPGRVTPCINGGINFCAEPAPTSPNGLIAWGVFFLAPALC